METSAFFVFKGIFSTVFFMYQWQNSRNLFVYSWQNGRTWNRHIYKYSEKLALDRRKIVFVSGARQSSGTTLAKSLLKDSSNYLDRKPLFTVEVKLSDTHLDPTFKKFQKFLNVPHFQIIKESNYLRTYKQDNDLMAYVISFSDFFMKCLKHSKI